MTFESTDQQVQVVKLQRYLSQRAICAAICAENINHAAYHSKSTTEKFHWSPSWIKTAQCHLHNSATTTTATSSSSSSSIIIAPSPWKEQQQKQQNSNSYFIRPRALRLKWKRGRRNFKTCFPRLLSVMLDQMVTRTDAARFIWHLLICGSSY